MKLLFFILIIISAPSFSQQPDWVLNPDESNFKYAIVGSAMPQKMGKRAQYKMAEFAARKEYSSNKYVSIKSTQDSHSDATGKNEFQSSSTVSTSGMLDFSSLI